MKHKKKGRTLGRTATKRKQLFTNMTTSLLEHGSIVTTEAKSKELRSFVEPLITEAKGELTLHRRRRLLSKLGKQDDLMSLVSVAKEHAKRPGGYLRLTKMPGVRGDGAAMVRIEIIK